MEARNTRAREGDTPQSSELGGKFQTDRSSIRKDLPRPRHLQLDASLVLGGVVAEDAEGFLLRRVGVVDVVEQHLEYR